MSSLVNWPPSWSTLLLIPALFVGFTVHELAHALVAYLLGDTSQVERKRLSFNPFRHVSWLGMIAFLLVGFGWAKPVWMDPTRFRLQNRPLGMFLVSIAGVTANFLTALLVFLGMTGTVALVWMLTGVSPVDVLEFLIVPATGPDRQGMVVALSYNMMAVNLMLAFFNLLPLPPLDGFQALISLFGAIRRVFARSEKEEPAPATTTETTAEEASTLSPAQIHFNIGVEYHKAGQLDEAIARYRQSIAHDAGFALAYYNQGVAYLAKGRLPLAASAFRAAMQTADDVDLRRQADLRLRELAQVERDPEVELGPVPPPLEPGGAVGSAANGAPPLDPAVVRRLWLHLIVGGVVMLMLTVMAWLFVTGATLMAMMPAGMGG